MFYDSFKLIFAIAITIVMVYTGHDLSVHHDDKLHPLFNYSYLAHAMFLILFSTLT